MIRPGATAWSALITGVLIYEALAPEGELMSETVDRALARHPVLIRAILALVWLHLANLLPKKIDPFHYLAKYARVNR